MKTAILQPPYNFNQINIEMINSPHVIFTINPQISTDCTVQVIYISPKLTSTFQHLTVICQVIYLSPPRRFIFFYWYIFTNISFIS